MRGPETRLRKKIQDAIQHFYPSCMIFKIHGNPYQVAGIPDLVCCINGRFVGLEVKCPGKNATEIQQAVLNRISQARGISGVVHSISEALEVLQTLDSL